MKFVPAPPVPVLAGRYVLGAHLGSGGFADVWEAQDTVLGVQRAIKILSPDTRARRALKRRLQAEARAMAQIDHPNVLRVYDVGSSDGLDYVVMDLAAGGSLSERVGPTGVSARKACQWTLQMLAALDAAHHRGIIHRDVKPSNLLLDANGNALLADFGIARFQEAAVSHTRTGVAMGTLLFMAPEQRIDARSVGPTADLYAAGATLFHLLTGDTPVDLFAIAADSPRWLGVPPALVPFLQRATLYAPDARFADATAMADALAELAAQLPEDDGTPVPRRVRAQLAATTPATPLSLLHRGPPIGDDTFPLTSTDERIAAPPARTGTTMRRLVALLAVVCLFIGAVALWPMLREADSPDASPLPVFVVEPPAPGPPAPAVLPAPRVLKAAGGPPEAAPPKRPAQPKLPGSATAGRYTGVFNRVLDAELVIDGPDDRVAGHFITRSGGRVGTPREFRSPVAGKYDTETRKLVLTDQLEDASAGKYVLALSADGRRLDGYFEGMNRDQHVEMSLKRP